MTHGDPKHPKKNLYPVKRYELTATADAPGPWDSVKGYIEYEVSNRECVPRDSFTGGQNVPNVDFGFEMTRVNEKTWKGYFYEDLLQDEDYFGLGVCRWSITTVGPQFIVHGESFTSGDALSVLLRKGRETEYFRKKDFTDQSFTGDGALPYSDKNPKYIDNPAAFFPITVTVKEVTP